MAFGVDDLLAVGAKIIDKVIPDPEQKAKAQLALIEAQQRGELEAVKIQLSGILTEAQSADPWTSRARPSFLYVMYILILAGVPMGLLYAWQPAIAENISKGFGLWFNSIPEELYWLFGTGYLGYTGARTFEKRSLKSV